MEYFWKGKRIKDIKKWCKRRRERLLIVELTRTYINLFGNKVTEKDKQEIPECFFNTLRSPSTDQYKVLGEVAL